MDGLFTLIVLIVLLAIYFIPTIAAYNAHKRNAGAIFALNLLLGLTVIGWVVALVWAMTKDDPAVMDIRSLRDSGMRKCPLCAEVIRAEARVCRYCGASKDEPEKPSGPRNPAEWEEYWKTHVP
jgi:hypothetical protein